MSRYAIVTEDDNLEVVVGFDEGFERFFLTIADARTCTGESGSYLFHNLDHHPEPGMTLEDVAATLVRFGMTPPPELIQQLAEDARRFGVSVPIVPSPTAVFALPARHTTQASGDQADGQIAVRVVGWEAL